MLISAKESNQEGTKYDGGGDYAPMFVFLALLVQDEITSSGVTSSIEVVKVVWDIFPSLNIGNV